MKSVPAALFNLDCSAWYLVKDSSVQSKVDEVEELIGVLDGDQKESKRNPKDEDITRK
jgi:hypothetical protein